MEKKVNRVRWNVICMIAVTVLILCSCGSGSEQSGDRVAGAEAVSSSAVTDKLTEGKVMEETDLDIEGRHYEWIRYCREGEDIRVLGLRTKEDTLVVPAEFRGYPVRKIGGTQEEMCPEEMRQEMPHDDVWKEAAWTRDMMERTPLWNLDDQHRLEKIIVSEGVTDIEGDGFGRVLADEVILPESLKFIEDFGYYSSRVGKVVLKSKTAKLEGAAFSYVNMKEIKLPDDFQGEIGVDCFAGSSIETFQWPAIEMKHGIFSYPILGHCKNLKEVIFKENQKKITISDNEFIDCPKLKTLTFPATTGEVQYGHGPYADNYKEGGVETLVFLGKDTKLKCCNDEGKEILGYIPTGKIIAPKGSEAIRFAKKAKKAAYLSPDVSGAATENENGDDECYQPLSNYMRAAGEEGFKDKIKLVPVEYGER